DWPVMVAVPMDDRNPLLSGIDAHKSPGPNERIQGVVIHSDISVQRTRSIQQLKHKWNFVPGFNHLGHQVSPFRPESLSKLCSRLHGQLESLWRGANQG